MPENNLQNLSENEKRWFILRAKVYEEKLKEAFRIFRAEGIEPILIKGWAIAREYPSEVERVYADIDFCVAPELYEKACGLADTEAVRKINVDLHRGFRHLDTFEWNDLFENSRLISLGEEDVRILRPEDHFRVLCVHWLTDGGAYKEKLLDFYYLLKNYEDEFDWGRCLGRLSQARRGWIIKTVALVNKIHKLDEAKLPFAGELQNIPKWLIKALDKEWATDVRLVPIHTILGNRKELWRQLKKRFPPNAIQATIDMEGNFDNKPRIFYQVGSVFVRLKPSLKRVWGALGVRKPKQD